jgi:hypothetical protein
MSDKLSQAISLIKAGEKQQAGQLLAELLKTDPENERAWLWMSQVVQNNQQRRRCLQKVLQLNPANKTAHKALANLDRKTKAPKPAAKNVPARPPMPSRDRNQLILTVVALAIPFLAFAAGGLYAIRIMLFHGDVTPLIDVCDGWPDSRAAAYVASEKGTHLAIGAERGEATWQVSMWYIPWQAEARVLEETELVLCIEPVERVFIESCAYYARGDRQPSHWIHRYYNRQQAKIVSAKTGQILSSRTFTSENSGRGCRQQERFKSSNKVSEIDGTPISGAEVSAWVSSYALVE